MKTETFTHKISEHGNGLPADGAHIYDCEGYVLEVLHTSSIHTRQWQANYVYAVCERTGDDWWYVSEEEKDSLASSDYKVENLVNGEEQE